MLKKGFTLVELLVVISIIGALLATSVVTYKTVMDKAEDRKSAELVSNVKTALDAKYLADDGNWSSQRLINGSQKGDPTLDADAALGLKGYLSSLDIDTSSSPNKLRGYDKFGILTSTGVGVLKSKGNSCTESDVRPYLLRYAICESQEDFVMVPSPFNVKVRAHSCVWCRSKNGKKYIKSWQPGDEVK